MKRMATSLLVAAALVGCGEDDHEHETATPAATAAPTAAQLSGVTWHKDVKPLLDQACTRCHFDGGVGPGDFTTYEKAAPLAELMSAFTSAGLMPPPAADPGCRDYQGSGQMVVSEAQKQILADWAADGAPEGDPAEAPPPLTSSVPQHLDGADLEVRIPAYSPSFRQSGDAYTCFVLETGREEGFYITGFEPLIDETSMVHHLVLMADQNNDVRDAYGTQPFECHDDSYETDPQLSEVSDDWVALAAWAPGGGVIDLGEENGLWVGPGQVLVLQMHYYESSEEARFLEDTSGYRMRTAETVKNEVFQLYPGPYEFVIPAEDDNYSDVQSVKWSRAFGSAGMRLLGTFPHMHVLGKSYRSWIEHADGSESCVIAGPYDFDNQLSYMFNEPVDWMAGDTWHNECTWDNSSSNPNQIYSPPQTATYGEGTGDEMCFFITYGYAL